MEKPQIFVIGILAIALGFFALRFTADDPLGSSSSHEDADQEYAMAGGDLGPGGFSSRSDRSSDRGVGSSASGRVSRFGRASGGPGSTGARGGSAETATGGGTRDRGGRLGAGISGRGMGAAAEAGRPSSRTISERSTTQSSRASGESRDARVDMLTGKETELDPFYEEKQLDDDPTDDVLLEVTNKEDVDRKAEVLEDVEASDDGEWLEVGEDAMLTFPDLGNANPDAGTVSLDIIPNWNGADVTDNSLFQIREPHMWENRMQLVKNGQFLRFIVTDDTGHEADISYKIPDWVQGDAHRIQATWDNGVTTLYIDGKRVGSNTYPGNLKFKPNTPMHLGSDLASGGSYGGANSKIGNFKVFGEPKGPDDI